MTEPRIPPLDINNLDADAQAILQPMIDAGRPWNIFLTLASTQTLLAMASLFEPCTI